MVRGRNTNGMVGFSAFFSADVVEGLSVTNARFVDSDDVVYLGDTAKDRLSDHEMSRIIGLSVCGALRFASEFHRLNVRLARLRKGGSGIKSLRLSLCEIPLPFIGRRSEAGKTGPAGMIYEVENAGSVRGPPHCGLISELYVRRP